MIFGHPFTFNSHQLRLCAQNKNEETMHLLPLFSFVLVILLKYFPGMSIDTHLHSIIN